VAVGVPEIRTECCYETVELMSVGLKYAIDFSNNFWMMAIKKHCEPKNSSWFSDV
jgi:hypothetical protein